MEEIDPNAGEDAAVPEVILERTGVKRVADTRVEDIDPSAGDGTDVVNMEEDTCVESTQFRPQYR